MEHNSCTTPFSGIGWVTKERAFPMNLGCGVLDPVNVNSFFYKGARGWNILQHFKLITVAAFDAGK